ncbi:mitochondrial intermediate peptidase 2 [Kockovaella imperatae]|uniref:Mitochondrial intermediate peptidase 1 n=1 Tax=Kockovaella imperatae TaxID=4999 RepID=A0A1Y1UPB5_9TREE|nr:mitochondrial intermediate peptidase 2 [Kockovaella imperatae]ORX39849.1 mitochondrial intermediate peptidase 2 [Kockovaella imperatae]
MYLPAARAGPSTIAVRRRLVRTASSIARAGPDTSLPRSAPLTALAHDTSDHFPPFASSSPRPIYPSTPTTADDELLKAHFDAPNHQTTDPSSSTTGLFQFPPLTSPKRLRPLTERALVLCRALQQRIQNAPMDPTGRELRLVVKNFDRLSDTLCGVIDLCEKVRHLHPDPKWVQAAEEASDRLNGYMNMLNVDEKMYQSLRACLAHDFADPLSQSERSIAKTFESDFEKFGIHLSPRQRAKFVDHSNRLLAMSRDVSHNAQAGPSSGPPIHIPNADKVLAGMGAQFITNLTFAGENEAVIEPGSWQSHMILRFARDGELRRQVYIGNQRYDAQKVETLEAMLRERATLAGVLGKESWADAILVDKMARNPAQVMGFLNSLAQHHRPAALTDIAALQRLKASSLTGNHYPEENPHTAHLPALSAWDRDYYTEKYMSSLSSKSMNSISQYFTVGSALLGASRLFTQLYGISFKPVAMSPGESWHPWVRRLDVIDEKEGRVGTIYCDLFAREGKTAPAAHYTVRCARRVDDDDAAGDGLPEEWDAPYGQGLEVFGETMRGKEGRYQLPVAVLTCDFGLGEDTRPALLSWQELETLFHELGHAMHSMIGRTDFHNVSGTRVATDFCELPSILMEYFVSSPRVLSLFAAHHQTGEPLPHDLLRQHLKLKDSLSALETHQQILLSILDQQYHTISPSDTGSLDSTAILKDLTNTVGVVPFVEGTAWQPQFGHLQSYGATYYSYLFDRAIAGKIWHTLFSHSLEDNISRRGGEEFKEKILKWGGGKDPWELVASVIGGAEGDIIAKGDAKAMEMVGGWMTQPSGSA